MGKLKEASPVETDHTFTPQINDNSRKLSIQHIYGTKQAEEYNTEQSTPRFMQFTVACRESVELGPLKRVPKKENSDSNLSGNLTEAISPVKPIKRRQSLGPILDRKSSNFDLHSSLLGKCIQEDEAAEKNTEGSLDPYLNKGGKKKGRRMSVPEYNSETFTFHPKVSEQSTKIAEGLGTDFMARQQQHLEKQKKHVEQANLHYRATNPNQGNTSPVQKRRASRDMTKDVSKSTSKEQEVTEDDKENDSPSADVSGTSLKAAKSGSGPNLAPVRAPPKKVLSQSSGLQRLAENGPEGVNDPLPVTSRSKTMPPPDTGRRMSRKASMTMLDLDRLKNAKNLVDRAIKTGKIFTIQGPYAKVRLSLRKRGWVEKFYKMQPKKKPPPVRRSKRDDDADDDDDDGDSSGADDDADDKPDDRNYCPPWEEDGGVYGIMSRMVRNSAPTLIWCLKRDAVDYRFLGRDQVVNHYCRAGSFTTKVGLCMNMRNVPWFDNEDPDTFFPRCYRLSADDDKDSFIADYRLTACMNVLKLVVEDHERRMLRGSKSSDADNKEPGTNSSEPGKTSVSDTGSKSSPDDGAKSTDDPSKSAEKTEDATKKAARKKKPPQVPTKCLEFALVQCEKWLQALDHLDIDTLEDPANISDETWDQFIRWYYQIIHDGAKITNADSRIHECDLMTDDLREKYPQFDLDGTRNTWIVKPGAKSRGRGIMVLDKLEEMLKLVAGTVVKKEGKWVVQKYMERPLLVYNTKFDIRQWFLVTDWNPLTIYFYKDSYLRFCSQQYTLEKFDEAIHLANNSIQKNYSNDKTRSSKLPEYNMWSHHTFKEYLVERGETDAWEQIIYPGMQKAISCALLTSQDFVEYRKAAFELYGADFMLTEDLKPWLIEINSSPAMDPSSPVTAKLCTNVLDDVMKVVVDRRYDKNCDIGSFELSYRQTQVTVPPYIGINLSVDGTAIRRPGIQPHALRIVAPVTKQEEPQPVLTQSLHTSPYAMPLTHSKSGITGSTASQATTKTASNTTVVAQQKTNPTEQRLRKEERFDVSNSKELQPQLGQLPPGKTLKREKKEKSQSVSGLKTGVATVVDLKKPSSQGVYLDDGAYVDDGAWGRLCDRCGSAISTRQDDCQCSTDHVSRTPSRTLSRSPPRARSARISQLRPRCVSLSQQFSPPKPPTPPILTSFYSARIPRLSVIRQDILSLESALHGPRHDSGARSGRPRPRTRLINAKRQSTPGHVNNDNFPHRISVRKPRYVNPVQLTRNHQIVANLISQGHHR